MRERPILFQGAMVRALLAGTKTQTRRVVKPTPRHIDGGVPYGAADPLGMGKGGTPIICPYGQPGDRLWVREAWRTLNCWDRDSPTNIAELCLNAGYPKPWAPTQYEADDARDNWMSVGTVPGVPTPGKLRPSIHMPRWASRITLEITGVRVERLQDISEADALAEGVDVHPDHHGKPRTSIYSPVQAYRDLWEQINGPGSWDANPWVWVIAVARLHTAARGTVNRCPSSSSQ